MNEIVVKAGQIWRDNYDCKTGYFRHVKIIRVGALDAEIQRCEPDGSPTPRSPMRITSLRRFNGGKSGFTLIKEPA